MQLNCNGLTISNGLSRGPYAPTIRYHNNTFYVRNTLINGQGNARNFFVTATNPANLWSEPYWLDGAPGIDPLLIFDDDGRAWYTGNRMPVAGANYPHHKETWLQELDLETMQRDPTYPFCN